MVWGSLYSPQTTDADGNPLVIKQGPDAGKPAVRYAFGLAIRKGTEQSWTQTPWGQEMVKVAQSAFAAGQWQQTAFSWKVKDGDSTVPGKDKNATRPCDKEGFPGHWVVSFSSGFAPTVYDAKGTREITEVDAVKCGYFIQVYGSVDGNGSTQQPGIYVNHSMVSLQGYGDIISYGPDASAMMSP